MDFSDRSHIREILGKYGVPDTFIHLGWGNVYQPHDPVHLTTNLQDGMNLVDELYDFGAERFLLVGSSSEYGERTGALSEEIEPLGQTNDYVRAKSQLASYGLKMAEERSKKFIHVRLFYAYGAGQKHNSLINQLFRSHLEGARISLSPCEQYRDYIHVSDAAEGIKRICNVNRSAILNLGSGAVIQLREFVELLWKELGSSPDLLAFGAHDRPVHEQSQPHAFADLTNLRTLTSWSPSLSISEGIKRTVSQLIANASSGIPLGGPA